MTTKKFLNGESVVLEKEGYLSSYSLVRVEFSESSTRLCGVRKFPAVRGYIFEWGVIKEYEIRKLFIWQFYFPSLLEKMEIVGRTADDALMTCLAFFDLDFWPDGISFWGKSKNNWPSGNSIWQIGGARPAIAHCAHKIPNEIELFHGTETDTLTIACEIRKVELAREWIGNVFLSEILPEMLRKVEESLLGYSSEESKRWDIRKEDCK